MMIAFEHITQPRLCWMDNPMRLWTFRLAQPFARCEMKQWRVKGYAIRIYRGAGQHYRLLVNGDEIHRTHANSNRVSAQAEIVNAILRTVYGVQDTDDREAA